MRNSTPVEDSPSEIVEETFLTPEMPATASSIFFVTWASISAGAAPVWMTRTETSGTSMLGKRVIGRALNDCQPRTISMTKASSGAIGFLIDQAEKFTAGPPRPWPGPG